MESRWRRSLDSIQAPPALRERSDAQWGLGEARSECASQHLASWTPDATAAVAAAIAAGRETPPLEEEEGVCASSWGKWILDNTVARSVGSEGGCFADAVKGLILKHARS